MRRSLRWRQKASKAEYCGNAAAPPAHGSLADGGRRDVRDAALCGGLKK